jgi:hypothetical protein
MLLEGRSAYDADEATQARQLRTLFLPAVLEHNEMGALTP